MKTEKGIGVSEGIAIGNALVIDTGCENACADTSPHDVPHELQKLEDAIDTFCRETEALAARMERYEGGGDILRGHIAMIRDPYMQQGIRGRIEAGASAQAAVDEICGQFADTFESAGDELVRQRAADVRDIRASLCRLISGCGTQDLSALPPDTVLVLDELTPSMTARLDHEHLCGIVTCRGGMTSHSAILARAMRIPAVLGLAGATEMIANGDTLALDGGTGEVHILPDESTLTAMRTRLDERKRQDAASEAFRGKPTVTADGHVCELLANIGTDREVEGALKHDAEGVGLFRTEFLFIDRRTAPDEETQFTAYRTAAEGLSGRPLIIRTLDVGGDKNIPYLDLDREENPFLGFRAIRYCLAHPELFLTQLRAILRASVYGDVRILLPLVTCTEELTAARELIEQAKGELNEHGERFREDIPVGVMIETPAACLIADLLARDADFFSIGTNDLTQYIMATDRGNARVGGLYSVCQPAVLRAIRHVIDTAHRTGIPVGMCGESASDPLLTPLWVAFGLDEFSVTPAAVLSLRARIGRWSREAATRVADEVMKLSAEQDIRAYLQNVR